MWIRHEGVPCAQTAALFWKTTSSCPRSSLWREAEAFRLLWASSSLPMVRTSDACTQISDGHTRQVLFRAPVFSHTLV